MFKTTDGFFEYMLMPFRLSNALATFSRLMNQVLKPFLGDLVIVYIGNILVYRQTYVEHVRHVHEVVEKFLKKVILINLEKSTYFQKKLVYLRHIISKNGVQMDPQKIHAIVKWPSPQIVTKLQIFHRMVNVYCKYIQHFSKSSYTLTWLIKRDKKNSWNKKVKKSFKELMKHMTTSPIFVLPNFQEMVEVQNYARGLAIGGLLFQDNKLIALFSEKLNEMMKWYYTHNLEFYAVVQALRNQRHYLLPKEFMLETDHNALNYLQNQEKLQAQHAKWVRFLQEYSFVIKHKPSVENKGGHLSRKRSLLAINGVLSRCKCLMITIEVEISKMQAIKDLYVNDSDFQEVFSHVLIPCPVKGRSLKTTLSKRDICFSTRSYVHLNVLCKHG